MIKIKWYKLMNPKTKGKVLIMSFKQENLVIETNYDRYETII